MRSQPLLIDGDWVQLAEERASFQAANPATGDDLPERYPLSEWDELDRLLDAGARDARTLAQAEPAQLGAMLEGYASRIEMHAEELATQAALETGLPAQGRYGNVEIPRTLRQLRDAAACARDQNWTQPVIDHANNLRSHLEPLGKPILVVGPNNFPFAYNGVAGGDFAAAIATGHAVIAKAHPAHPGTTRHLARLARQAAADAGLPPATVQLFYHCSNPDGLRLASDPRLGAIGFTGSERAGRALKAAADSVGIPAYFEMSGVNPVGILPGAMRERPAQLATVFSDSCLQGVGQFCTNPGLVFTVAGTGLDAFLRVASTRFAEAKPGPMLTASLVDHLAGSVAQLRASGATLLAQSDEPTAPGFRPRTALLRVDAERFLTRPDFWQSEMFGPASLVVVARDALELGRCYEHLQASLTGALFTAQNGEDDPLYQKLVDVLKPRIGRVLNDKMPTGVTVSPAMMHGGPFPAGGHPGFTAVGMPASLRRFGALRCYDNVREHRLPPTLRDENPIPALWRCIDGTWTTGGAPLTPFRSGRNSNDV